MLATGTTGLPLVAWWVAVGTAIRHIGGDQVLEEGARELPREPPPRAGVRQWWEPNASRGGTPRGVKAEGSGNNGAGTLRQDATVSHPKASGEETEKVPEGLIGTPAGVKTEGRGEPVTGATGAGASTLRATARPFHTTSGCPDLCSCTAAAPAPQWRTWWRRPQGSMASGSGVRHPAHPTSPQR